MLYRVLDLRYSRKKQGIDDEPLQRLLHGHEIISTADHFYVHEGEPHLLVCVAYRLGNLDDPQRKDNVKRDESPNRGVQSKDREKGDSEWKFVLKDENASLFETLRAWRTLRARADAVPPYIVLTNVQLAHVANEKPKTLSALKEVPGLGKGRAERFGREILGVVSSGVVPNEMKPSRNVKSRKPSKQAGAKKEKCEQEVITGKDEHKGDEGRFQAPGEDPEAARDDAD